MEQQTAVTIDEYIEGCVPKVQPFLKELCQCIREAAPQAGEKLSWGMATFTHYGNLVHFASEKKHAGFHPGASAIMAFEKELSKFHYSKGTLQLPYDKPLPFDLIGRMVRFRIEEQEALAEMKKKGQKTASEPRPRYVMPDDLKDALKQENLTQAYEARPPYQRNDYIGWIMRAKRPETREKRTKQMLEELRAGNAYMGMAYGAKK